MSGAVAAIRDKPGFAWLAAALTAPLIAALIWVGADGLAVEARVTLIVFALAMIGWLMTPADDTTVALLAVLALLASGSIPEQHFFSALGNELVWLLIAAFVIAAVLRQAGIAERWAASALQRVGTMRGLFHTLSVFIAATAFVIPSTSARAAILLPVFMALTATLRDAPTQRALALLFPTVILLSACGSLTGAGAHLVALDLLSRVPGGETIDYLRWTMLTLPIALLTSHAAAELILHLFLAGERNSTIRLHLAIPGASAGNQRDFFIVAVVAATVILWATADLHGVGLAVTGLAAALLLTIPALSGVTLKAAVKAVEWPLILFLAATTLLGQSLITTGAGNWIAESLLTALPRSLLGSSVAVATILALIALLSHLVIVSRSARAAVLVPAIALPLASLGYSPAALVLLTIVGTGFCQTFPVSAKPVTLYAGIDGPTYSPADLLRLAIALFPVLLVILLVFALVIWPALGLSLTR